MLNKYTPFVKNLNTLWYHYILCGTQPSAGKQFEGSEFQQHIWLNGTYYYSKTLSLYYMQQKQNLLSYADKAIELVPKIFPALVKVFFLNIPLACIYHPLFRREIKVIVPLIYLDWISRSSLARELYGTNSRTNTPSPKYHAEDQ